MKANPLEENNPRYQMKGFAMSKKVMIVGANFANKGAQSMLFVTMDEIYKRIPDAAIYFMTNEKGDFTEYRFEKKSIFPYSISIALEIDVFAMTIKRMLKDTAKFILGKRDNLWQLYEIKKIMPTIDLMIDISGFAIGKKWDVPAQEAFLDHIRLAKKYNIPIWIMPQSFGPFDYPDETKYILRELEELLPYPSVIYAREKEGYYMLKDTFQLKNVVLSSDMVLQNKGVDLNNIYKNPPQIVVPEVLSCSVGIIPNMQCFRHGNREKNLEIYKGIVKKLLEMKKEVYVFRHSAEDLDICKEIYYSTGERIHLLENNFSCFEYDAFVRQFDFVICSRYHGIVHAYRNYVPSILLGWAVKYKELAELFGQGEYFFDITESGFEINDVVKKVEKMCIEYKNESDVIRNRLEPIQEENCFAKMFEEINLS